jgi:hypothetical protein
MCPQSKHAIARNSRLGLKKAALSGRKPISTPERPKTCPIRDSSNRIADILNSARQSFEIPFSAEELSPVPDRGHPRRVRDIMHVGASTAKRLNRKLQATRKHEFSFRCSAQRIGSLLQCTFPTPRVDQTVIRDGHQFQADSPATANANRAQPSARTMIPTRVPSS